MIQKKYKGPFSMNYREQGSHARGVSHTGYLEPGNNKGEARGRSRHKNNAKVVRNLEERNVARRGKVPNKT